MIQSGGQLKALETSIKLVAYSLFKEVENQPSYLKDQHNVVLYHKNNVPPTSPSPFSNGQQCALSEEGEAWWEGLYIQGERDNIYIFLVKKMGLRKFF